MGVSHPLIIEGQWNYTRLGMTIILVCMAVVALGIDFIIVEIVMLLMLLLHDRFWDFWRQLGSETLSSETLAWAFLIFEWRKIVPVDTNNSVTLGPWVGYLAPVFPLFASFTTSVTWGQRLIKEHSETPGRRLFCHYIFHCYGRRKWWSVDTVRP